MKTAVEKLFNIWLEKEYISPNEWSEAIEMEKQIIFDFARHCLDKEREVSENDSFLNVVKWYNNFIQENNSNNETFKQQETETYPCPQCQGGGCPYCCGYGTIPK